MTQRPTWDECPECSEHFERKVWNARGVLCFGCNIALGHAKDDPNILRRIASYIERA